MSMVRSGQPPRIPDITLEAADAARLRNAFALARFARQGLEGLRGLEVVTNRERGRVERVLRLPPGGDLDLVVRWDSGRSERLTIQVGAEEED